MKNDEIARLLHYAEKVREPENLFAGKRLPANYRLPDNILVFFHTFTAPAPNAHGRCTLVFPFDTMTYYVDRRKLALSPGMMLFVPPYAVRFLHPRSGGARRLFVTFDDPGSQSYLPAGGCTRPGAENWRALRRFLREYRNGSAESASASLMEFLSGLPAAPGEALSGYRLPSPLEKAIEFIESHLELGSGIKEIADRVGLSESYLRTLFRREMGVSLGRFIAGKRLDAARYRLLHSDLPLSEIASGCGFANVFVFSAFFKKQTGLPPLRFRRERMAEAGR